TKDFGFSADHVIELVVQPRLSRYARADGGLDEGKRKADGETLLNRLRELPGVEAVANGAAPLTRFSVAAAPRVVDVDGESRNASFVELPVGAGYFSATGIPILAGRDIDTQDLANDARPTIVVSLSLARLLWQGHPAIGHHVQVDGKLR